MFNWSVSLLLILILQLGRHYTGTGLSSFSRASVVKIALALFLLLEHFVVEHGFEDVVALVLVLNTGHHVAPAVHLGRRIYHVRHLLRR